MSFHSGIRGWLVLTGLSLIFVPFLVYLGGTLLAGPYEGERGITGLLSDVWGDALSGSPSAWLLLLGPVLLAIIWRVALLLRRRATRVAGAPAGASRTQ